MVMWKWKILTVKKIPGGLICQVDPVVYIGKYIHNIAFCGLTSRTYVSVDISNAGVACSVLLFKSIHIAEKFVVHSLEETLKTAISGEDEETMDHMFSHYEGPVWLVGLVVSYLQRAL